MARSWSNRAGVARAVCLARLCQALLQPELCLRGPGGAAAAAAAAAAGGGRKSGGGRRPGLSKGTATAASALEVLRGVLAEATGTPVSPMAPMGKVRREGGCQRWCSVWPSAGLRDWGADDVCPRR